MNKTTKNTMLAGLIATSMMTGITTAADTKTSEKPRTPYTLQDGEWISIAGKVTKSGPDAFVLDYGKGAITIEMDDYDWFKEGYTIWKNDKVVVVGRVDADEGHKRTIEASTVYVKKLNATFYANSDDDEEVSADIKKLNKSKPMIMLTGEITSIKGKDMIVDTGYNLITVSTVALTEDAFDKSGKLELKVGDEVEASGILSDGFEDSNSLVALKVEEK